ncbi:MAG: CBS domain-containing protein [Gammaproteobacteria bacterium]
MPSTTTISEVMTESPLCVDMDCDLVEANRLMSERGVRHLPVTENGQAAAMLSERDIHLAIAVHKDLRAAKLIKVREVCTLDTYSVPPDASLADVAAHMAETQIGSALVVRDDKVVGIYTATDACRELAKRLNQ